MTTPNEGIPGLPGDGQIPPLPPEFTAAIQQAAARRLMEAAAKQGEAEPLTALDGYAIALRTYFEALVRAGFTDTQALYWLAQKF